MCTVYTVRSSEAASAHCSCTMLMYDAHVRCSCTMLMYDAYVRCYMHSQRAALSVTWYSKPQEDVGRITRKYFLLHKCGDAALSECVRLQAEDQGSRFDEAVQTNLQHDPVRWWYGALCGEPW
eukprot:19456-Heterococcus_DN1.PRE.1